MTEKSPLLPSNATPNTLDIPGHLTPYCSLRVVADNVVQRAGRVLSYAAQMVEFSSRTGAGGGLTGSGGRASGQGPVRGWGVRLLVRDGRSGTGLAQHGRHRAGRLQAGLGRR